MQPPRPGLRRRGLGRGLDALLGPAGQAAAVVSPDEGPGSEALRLVEVDPGLVDANPEQPRQDFDETALAELADSIRIHGLLQPIVVERAGDRYRLVAGERRLRAARLARLAALPAIVRPAAESARQSLELALTENLSRAELSPIEEASAYARLADTFGLSHEAIALRLGRSRPAVSNLIRLLSLPAPVQRAVVDGMISAGHARALLGLPGSAAQEEMARRVQQHGWSVRQTERAVQDAAGRTAAVPVRAVAPAGRPPSTSPDDDALRRGFEERVGLPVEVRRHGRGGSVVITFHAEEDLDALYTLVGGPPL